MKKLFAAAALAATAALAAPAADASVVIDVSEVEVTYPGAAPWTNTVFSYSGSLDLTGLGEPRTFDLTWLPTMTAATLSPSAGGLYLSKRGFIDIYDNVGAVLPKYGDRPYWFRLRGEGSIFGLNLGSVNVSSDYVSGGSIQGTLTAPDSTIEDIGLFRGTFSTQLINGETITINIPSPSVVPLPAALPLLLAGLGALGVAGRRRRAA